MPSPVGMEKLTSGPVSAFVGMCAEIIPLSLQQISGKTFSTVTIEIG